MESYSAAEAARLLRVSIPTLKRLCGGGQIPCFRTPGGHLRIPADALKTFQGKPSGSTTSAPSSVLANRRERVEELNLEGQELRASRDLEKLRAEQDQEEERRAAQVQAQQLERQARIEATRFEHAKEERRAAREREEAERARQRRDWQRRWSRWATPSFPDWLAADQIGLLEEAVNAALGDCEPGDPDDDVAGVLKARIERLIAPWRAEREARAQREQLVQRAVHGLPFGATDGDKARATAAVRSALEQVPLGASDMELRAAVAEAMAPTHQAIGERQERDRREQLVASAPLWLPWGAREGEKAGAAAAVREALAKVPLRASQTEVQSAMAGALAPIKEDIEERSATQRQQAQRQRAKSALITFAVFYASNYLDELDNDGDIELEPGEDFDDVRCDFEAMVRNALEQKLTGDETQDQANRIAREVVDDELE